jgi:hypothetical protein
MEHFVKIVEKLMPQHGTCYHEPFQPLGRSFLPSNTLRSLFGRDSILLSFHGEEFIWVKYW